MDRQTIYTTAIPRSVDFLQNEQNTMVALAKIAEIVLGTSAQIGGFSCGPTGPASLAVVLGAGQIFQLASLEATNWSSLTADTAHTILKQGIALDTQTINITPPATSGFSQVFLIEVQYSDLDAVPVVLPYFNPATPFPQPSLNGPGGSGVSQNTVRKGVASVQLKAGTAALTGTQTPPSVDAGWVGLYYITVANGQSTITSGNIAAVTGAPFLTATLPQMQGLVQSGVPGFAVDTGTANSIVAAFTPPITSLVDGMRVRVRIKNAVTGATTLNVGPGAVTVRQGDASTLANGDLLANQIADFTYDAALTAWQLIRAGESAKANQLIAGPAIAPPVNSIDPGPVTGNYILSNDATLPNTDINVSAGRVRDDTGVSDIAVSATLFKRLQTTGSWAPGGVSGTVQNCLDTGVRALSNTYHIYGIGKISIAVTARARLSNTATLTVPSHGLGVGTSFRAYGIGGGYDGLAVVVSVPDANTITFANSGANETTVVVTGAVDGYDILASLSATAPTMPSGWTVKKVLGSFLTDASNNIIPMLHVGDEFLLITPILDLNNPTPGTGGNLATASVPKGVRVEIIINIVSDNTNATAYYISCPDTTDLAPNNTLAPLGTAGAGGGGTTINTRVVTNTSGQYRYRSLGSQRIEGATLGWRDFRRRMF